MIDNSDIKHRPEECQFCNFETEALRAYRVYRWLGSGIDTSTKETHKWLCLLCASTMAGSAQEYPEQYGNHANDFLQAICFVGNVILSKLESLNTKELK